MKFLFRIVLLFSIVLTGCNKDDEFYAVAKPIITFDHENGIYEVNVGEELTLNPTVENGENAEYRWTLDDGTVICRERVWTSRWDEAGEYYALLSVTNAGGTAREEVRIDVIAKLPPSISLALPSTGLTIKTGTSYEFAPLFGNIDKNEALTVEWIVDGQKMGDEQTFTFTPTTQGTYNITVRATNSSGTSEKSFTVSVADSLPASIRFVPLSYFTADSVRYTVAGRSIGLQAIGENVSDDGYEWHVNGERLDCNQSYLSFTPSTADTYNIMVSNSGAQTTIKVVCMAEAAFRTYTSGMSDEATKVLEYVPAPGQFIGETSSIGGMTESISTRRQAEDWAFDRLSKHKFVSLGAWGGYIIAGFDHSIKNNRSGYDFAIMSNAISTSNEPGIVWVMQDVNGNGLADDEWYELRGSDFGGNAKSHAWSTTYYRPAGDCIAVQWIDLEGTRGQIDYLGDTHSQPSYYPKWIDATDYTLYGSRLAPRNTLDPATGFWSNPPFGWGYADNLGSDLIDGDTQSGAGQWIGFKISNAVLPDGASVNLNHIDFIKVQTGVMASSGRLGELSTEILAIRDL